MTLAHQAPLSVEFTRQEYWSGLSFSSPGDLPDSGVELRSQALQADSLPSKPPVMPLSVRSLSNDGSSLQCSQERKIRR